MSAASWEGGGSGWLANLNCYLSSPALPWALASWVSEDLPQGMQSIKHLLSLLYGRIVAAKIKRFSNNPQNLNCYLMQTDRQNYWWNTRVPAYSSGCWDPVTYHHVRGCGWWPTHRWWSVSVKQYQHCQGLLSFHLRTFIMLCIMYFLILHTQWWGWKLITLGMWT